MIKIIKLILRGLKDFWKDDNFESIDHYYKQDHIHDKEPPTYITGIGKIKKDNKNE
jgi:hypothetical protein